jgi:hypothetical protein
MENWFPQVLYRGLMLETRMVYDVESRDAAIAEGWHDQPWDALDAATAPPMPTPAPPPEDAPPTRAELEEKATELGIKFDGRTSDRKLSGDIAAKLAE